MRKVIVDEWMSLDGVVQAPGAPDEDTTGEFRYGGWHLPYFDEESRAWVVESIAGAGGYLFGRRTFEILGSYWPRSTSEEEKVLAEPLNTNPKYVASTTLSEPLEWQNARLLGDDVSAAVTALKRQDGDDLVVIGSTRLVATLLDAALVDEVRLMIDPLVLGGGKRLFPEDGVRRALRLLDSRVTSTGAILARYALDEG
jgi:dihydrofolate reductase